MRTRSWLFMPVIGLVVGAVAVLGGGRVNLPEPAWLAGPLIILLALLVPMAMLRRRRIALEDGVLVVQATFYTRRQPLQALALDKARIVDLGEHTEYKPRIKTNGYALPGFAAGHFRLGNLGKAFCLLTDFERVLVLPQKDGALLLLSPERPQAVLDALRAGTA
ncbi:MAG: hypothetical protein EOP93_24240 [Lysobacteraceae bacterium]|nr:MAG: hypothetical protein EOP93_24240 [Xanthomonadaceae bacterium]